MVSIIGLFHFNPLKFDEFGVAVLKHRRRSLKESSFSFTIGYTVASLLVMNAEATMGASLLIVKAKVTIGTSLLRLVADYKRKMVTRTSYAFKVSSKSCPNTFSLHLL